MGTQANTLAAACAAGDPQACAEYYKTSYAAAPSVVAAQPAANQPDNPGITFDDNLAIGYDYSGYNVGDSPGQCPTAVARDIVSGRLQNPSIRECDALASKVNPNYVPHFSYALPGDPTPNANIWSVDSAGKAVWLGADGNPGVPPNWAPPPPNSPGSRIQYDPSAGWTIKAGEAPPTPQPGYPGNAPSQVPKVDTSKPPAQPAPSDFQTWLAACVKNATANGMDPAKACGANMEASYKIWQNSQNQPSKSTGVDPGTNAPSITANTITVAQLIAWMTQANGQTQATADQWAYAFNALTNGNLQLPDVVLIQCGMSPDGSNRSQLPQVTADTFLNAVRDWQLHNAASNQGPGGTTNTPPAPTGATGTGPGVLGPTTCKTCQNLAKHPLILLVLLVAAYYVFVD